MARKLDGSEGHIERCVEPPAIAFLASGVQTNGGQGGILARKSTSTKFYFQGCWRRRALSTAVSVARLNLCHPLIVSQQTLHAFLEELHRLNFVKLPKQM